MSRKPIFDAARTAGADFNRPGAVAALDAVLDQVGVPRDGLSLSEEGANLIHEFEGYEATTYPDPGPSGLPVTGGWGSTRDENGNPFKLGVTHDRAYWERLFLRDSAGTQEAVRTLIGAKPTTQNQYDALVSLAYNIGATNLGRSTLLKKHLAGDYAGARAEFAVWNKAKGVVLPGLVRRRAAEAALYGRKP